MCAHAIEHDAPAVELVDEHPVGFTVAIPPTHGVPGKLAVAVNGVQRLPGDRRPGENLELLQVLTSTPTALEVLSI